MSTSPSSIRVAACDLNGQARGKRLPGDYAAKLGEGVRMPMSALNLDIFGADIEDSPLVFETGDADGRLMPTARGPVPMPWLDGCPDLYPMMMVAEDGTPWAGDPMAALARVLDRYAARGWTVIAATELEFYLLDDRGEHPQPAIVPGTGHRLGGEDILSLQTLDAFDAYFSALYAMADQMGLPAQAAIAEGGVGQFEINLTHQEAMRAAEDTWLFKMLVKGLARKHGMAASFMAKPFADQAGNGMHVHFSVVDADGRNVFDDGGAAGTAEMRHAVAGCLAAMPGSTLVFAPHGNSYDRMVPGAHAPTAICWAHENRTASIRIPGGPPKARRIEHRVAGGDINPFLLLAAVLGAALAGIDDASEPPAPINGNAYDQDLPQMATGWEAAISAFETDPMIARIFDPLLVANFTMCKRQDQRRLTALDQAGRIRALLERV